MSQYSNKRILSLVFIFFLLAGCGYFWNAYLIQAHSSFERYYAFRGCKELVTKTDSDATCKLASGKMIRLVKIDIRWFLENDGPGIW